MASLPTTRPDTDSDGSHRHRLWHIQTGIYAQHFYLGRRQSADCGVLIGVWLLPVFECAVNCTAQILGPPPRQNQPCLPIARKLGHVFCRHLGSVRGLVLIAAGRGRQLGHGLNPHQHIDQNK